jgi:hypothetical protein
LSGVLGDHPVGLSSIDAFQIVVGLVIGGHGFSVRDQVPPKGARTTSGNAPHIHKKGLVQIKLSGQYQLRQKLIAAPARRDTGPAS